MQNLYMTLLAHEHLEELFQLLITYARFLFTALFVGVISPQIIFQKLLTKKLN